MAYDLIKSVERERDLIGTFNLGGFKDAEKLKAAYQTVIDDLCDRYTCPFTPDANTQDEVE